VNRRTITYAIDLETGIVWSRVGNKVAIPILDYKGLIDKETGSFKEPRFYLETFNIFTALTMSLVGTHLKWTIKVPIEAKNWHREFWGFPLLKPKKEAEDAAVCPVCKWVLCLDHACLTPTNTTIATPWEARDAEFFIVGTCRHCKATIEVGVNVAAQPITVPF